MLNSIAGRYLVQTAPLEKQNAQQKQQSLQPQVQETFEYNPMISKYMLKQASQILPTQKVNAINGLQKTAPAVWNNSLKTMLQTGSANIMGVIPRTMSAKDTDGNGLIQIGEQGGNFINAIDRLDEFKAMGINTLHVLPIHPTGKTLAMGIAGSLYAPDEFVEADGKLAVDPNLKEDRKSVV